MDSAARLLALSTILLACVSGCGARVAAGRGVVLSSSATVETRAASTPRPVEKGLRTGDYVVYRFSGSFRKGSGSPLVLTQRVLGREGNVLTLELVLEDGAKKETLHIRKDKGDEVLEVTRVDAAVTRSATVDAYEAMMAKTILAADRNDGQLGIETTDVRVGGKSLRCKKTSYRVRVGTHDATMSTVESDAFPWGDVAGDITTLDGKVLYRVEVVDAG
jgi:hypothetical protein